MSISMSFDREEPCAACGSTGCSIRIKAHDVLHKRKPKFLHLCHICIRDVYEASKDDWLKPPSNRGLIVKLFPWINWKEAQW